MEAAIFDDLTVLGDAVRSRMLVLLERHELTVGGDVPVLQLPQSTVSRHLKVLADAEWVTSRRDGTSRYYSSSEPPHEAAGRLWSLLARAGRRDVGGGSGRASSEERDDPAADRLAASSSNRAAGAGTSCARRCSARASHLHALAGSARRRLDRRRPRLRDRSRRRDARAIRCPGDRRRSVERHAAGSAATAARVRQTSRSAAASSRLCRSTTRRSMPRR